MRHLVILCVLLLAGAASAETLDVIDIDPSQATVCGCETSRFTVLLDNPSDAIQVYDLSVDAGPEVWASLKPEKVALQAGSKEALTMFVRPPCDSSSGIYSIKVSVSSPIYSRGEMVEEFRQVEEVLVSVDDCGAGAADIDAPSPGEITTIPAAPTGAAASGDLGFEADPWMLASFFFAFTTIFVIMFHIRKR